MFGLFKKKEPEQRWSDFGRYVCCEECNSLRRDGSLADVCRNCGSEKLKNVIARQRYHLQSAGFYMIRVDHEEYEIKT